MLHAVWRGPGCGQRCRPHVPRLSGSSALTQRGALSPPSEAGRRPTVPASPVTRRGWQPSSTWRRPGQAPLANPKASAAANAAPAAPAPIVLWFKHDLRLDDHPGLIQAVQSGAPIVPLFCFDPARYWALAHLPRGAHALAQAVGSLRTSLRQRGSDLVVRVGAFEEVVPEVARLAGASAVVAEKEVESSWALATAAVAAALPAGVKVQRWRAALYDGYGGQDDYEDWKKAGPGEPAQPLDAPPALPALPAQMAAEPGALPAASELLQVAARSYAAGVDARLAAALSSSSCGAPDGSPSSVAASSDGDDAGAVAGGDASALLADALIERLQAGTDDASGSTAALPPPPSWAWAGAGRGPGGPLALEAELAAELAAGEGASLDALSRYLSCLETEASTASAAEEGGLGSRERRAAAALAEAAAAFDSDATPGGCFPALFGRAVQLGVVSRRRISQEARRMLAEPSTPPGPLAPLVRALGAGGAEAAAAAARRRKAAAAQASAEASDFHEALAAAREGRPAHGGTLRHWRWRGVLADYLLAEPPAGTERPGAPALVLVHGFGAFGEHWRRNAAPLAAAGYRVYCPTLPGYGRAEKPALPYGQALWSTYVADFIAEVVRAPAVLAGNSIGGFVAASVAADARGAVQGLVLLNSAGLLEEGYVPPTEASRPSPPPTWVVNGLSKALFSFLRGDVSGQLRRLYPARPDRADDWLLREIVRAAHDPGALGVFRSVFYLPRPRALNWLVASGFGGPTAVLQGGRDPLNDARGRASTLARLCPNAEVSVIECGHCPHDELPEEVNSLLLDFLERRVLPAGACVGGAVGAAPAG